MQAHVNQMRKHIYIGEIVVIRRDNDEGHKSRVDRVMDVDGGMLLLQNDGWILPTDVLFIVADDFTDAVIRDLAREFRLSFDQARELPELVRQFRAQEDAPTYRQFQDITHQPPGDAKPIKLTITEVRKSEDGYRYGVAKGSKPVDGIFSDGDLQTFVEQGYLPMPETTDANEAETRVPEPEPINQKTLRQLKKEIADKTQEVNELLATQLHFVDQMAKKDKVYDDHLAERNAVIDKLTKRFEGELIGALERMSRIIQHQGRMLAEAVSVQQLPMETRTFQQLIPLEQRAEGYASDKSLNDVLAEGWRRVHTSDVIESNQIRRVHLLERVKPLQFPTGTTFHLGQASLADELVINGAESVADRMNEAIDNAIQRKREGKNQ